MANAGNADKELDTDAREFDPSSLVSKIFDTIKIMRANAAPQKHVRFDSASSINSSELLMESSVNCFLRLIGFPAIRDSSQIIHRNTRARALANTPPPNASQTAADRTCEVLTEDVLLKRLSQDGTLNYFHVAVDNQALTQISRREEKSAKKLSTKESIGLLQTPLSIAEIIDSDKDRRPLIFPLFVNADIPIYPQNKRVAPLFSKRDRAPVLSRPFLENIIYMRDVAAGKQSPEIVAALKANINKLIEKASTTSPATTESEAFKAEAALQEAQVSNFTYLQLQITDKFIKAIKKSAEEYRKVSQEAATLSKQITYIPDPKKEATEKAGEASLSDEQKTAANNEFNLKSVGVVDIDAQIEELEREKQKTERFIVLLPTEKIKTGDEIKKIGGEILSSNISQDVFLSEFMELVTFEKTSIEEKILEKKTERESLIKRYEFVRQSIIYFSGEFSGLSIFDVLCVLFALFTVERKYLLALLNEDARARAVANEYLGAVPVVSGETSIAPIRTIDDVEEGTSSIGVLAAVGQIDKVARSYFKLAESFYKAASSSGENKAKKE